MNANDRNIWAKTDEGKRIATARDLIAPIANGRVNLLNWFKGQAIAAGLTFRGDAHNHVAASVNNGRWIVSCQCHGAELADPAQPVFYCLSCGNEWNDHCVARVQFPPRREEGEALLVKRELRNRHWLPGETASALESENRKHGLD